MQVFIQDLTQINQNTLQNFQESKNSVDQIESRLNVREKGIFPAQPQPKPKTQFEVHDVQDPHMEHAKSVTTLRGGKVINKDTPINVSHSKENSETKGDDEPSDVYNKGEEKKIYKPVAPFPQRLIALKKGVTNQDILEVFQQVKVNIPMLDAIK